MSMWEYMNQWSTPPSPPRRGRGSRVPICTGPASCRLGCPSCLPGWISGPGGTSRGQGFTLPSTQDQKPALEPPGKHGTTWACPAWVGMKTLNAGFLLRYLGGEPKRSLPLCGPDYQKGWKRQTPRLRFPHCLSPPTQETPTQIHILPGDAGHQAGAQRAEGVLPLPKDRGQGPPQALAATFMRMSAQALQSGASTLELRG